VVDRGVGGRRVTGQPGALARGAAQHGVDEAMAAAAVALRLGQLDALRHGRVVGDAVEEEQLVEAEAQRRGDGRVELADGPGERGDVVIERAEALDGAVRELTGKGPVAADEVPGLRVQGAVCVGALLGHPPEDGEGGQAGRRDGRARSQHLPIRG
jgi:hypothetical protein